MNCFHLIVGEKSPVTRRCPWPWKTTCRSPRGRWGSRQGLGCYVLVARMGGGPPTKQSSLRATPAPFPLLSCFSIPPSVSPGNPPGAGPAQVPRCRCLWWEPHGVCPGPQFPPQPHWVGQGRPDTWRSPGCHCASDARSGSTAPIWPTARPLSPSRPHSWQGTSTCPPGLMKG